MAVLFHFCCHQFTPSLASVRSKILKCSTTPSLMLFLFCCFLSPVMCHGLAVGQITSHYFPVQRPMSWSAGREFCRSHFVDLAVLSSEEQYFTLLNAMSTKKASSWLGLQRQTPSDGWKWVDGAELGYQRWYRNNQEGRCATLEANSKTNMKLLARYCEEQHMVVCQGKQCLTSVTSRLENTAYKVNIK